MGIRRESIHLIEIAVEKLGGYEGLRMCELGNQMMRDMGNCSAKRYFRNLGVDHVSLDENGKDGAVAVDLSKPIPESLGLFDLVTNYGTSEHISDQYQVFKNIHDLTRTGGMMAHCVPMNGDWNDHGLVGYKRDFISALARVMGYRAHVNALIERKLKVDRGRLLVSGVLEKQQPWFVSREQFKEMGGIVEYLRLHSQQVRVDVTA